MTFSQTNTQQHRPPRLPQGWSGVQTHRTSQIQWRLIRPNIQLGQSFCERKTDKQAPCKTWQPWWR